MILYMLHLLMMIMMVNCVVSAPGQIDTANEMARAQKHKPRPKSSSSIDPLGGGNILRADSTDTIGHNFRSLNLLVSYQDDTPQNLVLVASEAKRRPSSSGTLDSIGGGHLLKIIEPDIETEVFKALNSFHKDQDNVLDDIVSVTREEKKKHSSRGTLDRLGGGNLVRLVDSGNEEEFFESLLYNQDNNTLAREDKKKPSSGTLDPIGGGNLVKIVDPLGGGNLVRIVDPVTDKWNTLESPSDIQDNMLRKTVAIAHEDKKKPSSSGTLDPIGGGNLVKIVDPLGGGNLVRIVDPVTDKWNTLESSSDIQESMLRKTVAIAREEKQKSSSSGTLDPIGNLIRIVDPEAETKIFNYLDPLIENQGRQNMMRLAREDKSSQRSSSHALDGLGGGIAGPYRGQLLRSHLTDSLDQGGDVLKMLDLISGSELLSSLDSAEGMAVLSALRKTHTKYPKRMLDSVSGWAFGESKRNFDEIDNVGFTGFAKRSPRYRQLALAKKNFDEIDRAGFETYNKRDFDEIDRTGFETFEKRDRKE